MEWGAAILAILKLIPDLIKLIQGLGEDMAKKRLQDWRKELDDATELLKKATTNEERIAAAKRLSSLVS